MRWPAALLLTLAVVAVPGPAVAKGPTDVEVSGPGIEAARHEAHDLTVVTGFSRRPGLLPAGRTEAELGPGYRLAWSAGDVALATSTAYPFSPGAWVRHPSGGGVRGGPELRRHLVALGASEPVVSPEAVWRAAYVLARGARALVRVTLRAWPPRT